MEVLFACPRCQQTNRRHLDGTAARVECPCGWSRSQQAVSGDSTVLPECVICGCSDLWRQKDFPQKLGLFLVGLAALLSTVAWWFYEPTWAIGILLVFAHLRSLSRHNVAGNQVWVSTGPRGEAPLVSSELGFRWSVA